ncbi:hypothetical protein LXM25_09960 [Dyadobacter sp. LJ53]|uniref:hypothetical protein n=1 Tax=Dyadobacter chenwenxiniae TaxID=2906456 RepID=UPI001F35377A|nr:hypothetical protein [Dyadobacter chenwenxiniae]MCF0050382.1 hypothetical protein [Dyadobacter chenwenxiniae]
MNIKYYGLLLFAALLSGCNNVVDVQEPDTEVVPESAIAAIKTSYPDAGQFIFKTLIKEKLWKAKFSSQANTFETQVSPAAISGDVFKNSADAGLYKGLTDKLKISGGILSNVQLLEKATDNAARMQYMLNGKALLLNYYVLNDWHIVKMAAPYPVESYTVEVSDVPEKIVSFCEAAKIELDSSQITVNEDQASKRTFIIHPQAALFPIFFDEAGNLKWIAKNSDGTPLENKPNDKVGSAALFEKIKAGYADFNVYNTLAFEAIYDDLSSIRYVFQRKSGAEGTRDFISETQEIFVNANSGEVIFEQYSSYVFR